MSGGLTVVAVVWLLGGAIALVGAVKGYQQGWIQQASFRVVLAYIAIGLAGGNLAGAGYDHWVFEFARDPDMRLTRALLFTVTIYYAVRESWDRQTSEQAKRGGKENGNHC